MQCFLLNLLSKISNSSSCLKCRHLVALDPMSEEDTRILFDDKLFCVQNINRVKLGRIRLYVLLHHPVGIMLTWQMLRRFLRRGKNILSARILVNSNWILILVFNWIRTNYTITRYSNPNGTSSTVEWLLYNNIKTIKFKESIYLLMNMTFVSKPYVLFMKLGSSNPNKFVLCICLISMRYG